MKVILLFLLLLIPVNGYALSAKEHFIQGKEYAAHQQYSKAIDEYLKAIKRNPYYKEAYIHLGVAYYEIRQLDEAVKALKKALELDPFSSKAHNNLGLVYECQDKLKEAEEEYEKALEIEPTNYEIHFNLARIYKKNGEVRRAISKYKEILKINPNLYLAYINLGTLHREEGDLDRAILYYEKAKEIEPKNTLAYLNLGSIYSELGWRKRARDEFEKALSISPNDTQVLYSLGLLYIKTKGWDSAIQIFKRIIEIEPLPLAHYNLALAYEGEGRYEEALKEYIKTQEMDPYCENAFYQAEQLLLTHGGSLLLKNKYASMHLRAGDYYYLLGNFPLALYEYKRAISLSPQDPKAHFALAKFYKERGFIDLAMEEFRKVRELDEFNIESRDMLEILYEQKLRGLAEREGIKEIPPPGKKMMVVGFNQRDVIHHALKEQANDMLISLFSQFPQVRIIDEKRIKEELSKLGLAEIKTVEHILKIGEAIGAELALYGKLLEEEENVSAEVTLMDVETSHRLLEFTARKVGHWKLRELISSIVAKVIRNISPVGEVIKVNEVGELIVNLGLRDGLKVGDALSVWRVGKLEIDPSTGEKIGFKERELGKVELVEVEAVISKARVIEPNLTRFIKIGDKVTPVKEER